jgi:hypothetical protein
MPVLDRSLDPEKGFRRYWEIAGPLTAAVLLFGLYSLFWPPSKQLNGSDNLTDHEAMDHTRFQIRDLLKADTYKINTLRL